jgi:hypothetical protein
MRQSNKGVFTGHQTNVFGGMRLYVTPHDPVIIGIVYKAQLT